MNTNQLTVGILAHVDAGKTTLAESMLFTSGSIRKAGRVDHGDAFLDTYELERARGITIFSKQARMKIGELGITLLDTPGHVDFSAEMERSLRVLDYAILVISGADGVQGHVQTLWELLRRYRIPVFLFINKMDQDGTDRAALLKELQTKLDSSCVDFGKDKDESEWMENVALCDEETMEHFLEVGELDEEKINELILERKVFPCFFGSALKMWGVEEFLQGLSTYVRCKDFPEQFGAKVYKIARDAKGERLTYMKITGGALKVKMPLGDEGDKVDQIRLYSGNAYETVQEVQSGSVCAVLGLSATYAGQGLGIEAAAEAPVLEPVLTYQVALPAGSNVHESFLKLRQLEEEIPELHLTWDKGHEEIHAQVMGEVQIEILKSLMQERFDMEVEFVSGSIVYKETIEEPIEGAGHFEPLRHYAEVHLLLEPLKRGKGLVFASSCSEDMLDKNWQRLILTHLEEKAHQGVLTGSEITDMKITLIAGRAHQKHTEGGDFRQATYRAVRQGLMKAKSIPLEPYYEFVLEIPSGMIGRAMTDIQRMSGQFEEPILNGDEASLKGTCPVETMKEYPKEVVAYTRGRGRLALTVKGYDVCHNAEDVIETIGYDAEADVDNSADSVFCSHGAGHLVSWREADENMHIKTDLLKEESVYVPKVPVPSAKKESFADEAELKAIFERTYGAPKKENKKFKKSVKFEFGKEREGAYKKEQSKKEGDRKQYLLVDGYNIIFAWEELKELAKMDMGAARGKLIDILANYQGYKKMTLILVFDAYKVEGNTGSIEKYHNIYVVYTKEAETADQYIEKTVHEIGKKYEVTVATSDATEQVIIMGQGAKRLSAAGLWEEITDAVREIRTEYIGKQQDQKQYLFENLSEELAEFMEDVRMGKKEFPLH